MDSIHYRGISVVAVVLLGALLTVGMTSGVAAQSTDNSTFEDQLITADDGNATVSIDVNADTFVTIDATLPANWSVESTVGPSGAEAAFVDGNYSWIQGGSGTYTLQLDVPGGETGQSGSFTVLRRVDSVTQTDTFDATVVTEPVSVADQSISTDGGNVTATIPANSFVRIDTAQLPDGWTISGTTPNADIVDNTVNWISPASDDTYSFELVPPQDVSSGTEVNFTASADVDGNSDSFTVTVTDTHESGASQNLVNTVSKQAGDDELDSTDILYAWSEYKRTGSVDNTPVETPSELLFLWDWYVTTQTQSE